MTSSDQLSIAEIQSRPFIIARNRHILPRERRIERSGSEYTVREVSDDSEGYYWFVVGAFEVAS